MKAAKSVFFLVVAAMPVLADAQERKAPAPPLPPAPPIMVAPPPPVMVAPRPATPLPPTTFQVEVLGGSERLWAGTLRVGNYNSASYNSTITESLEGCPADKSNLARYAPNSSRSVRIGIARRSYGYGSSENLDSFAISASWTRPGVPCEEDGTSNVSFDRPVTMSIGSRAEMKGDGGLVVRLTRIN
jgi:hypothetical protein